MKLLVTDPSLGVWEKRETGAERLPDLCSWPCSPCGNAELMAFCCGEHRECICLERKSHEMVCRMPCVPGIASMCFSPCSRFVFQLSSEADCIHTRSVSTGDLLFAVPVGVFPRSMFLLETGKYLLAAGGAKAEAYLFSIPELICEKVIHTRHPCFAAVFWVDGLALVCAKEGEDIQTVFYTLSDRTVRPQHLLTLPGVPGTVSMCPDRIHMLASTSEGVSKINLRTSEIVWMRPEWASCMRIQCEGQFAALSGTLDGRVYLLNHEKPWEQSVVFHGSQAECCFLC